MFDRKNSRARKVLDYLKYTPWFYTFIFGGKDLPWLITKFTQFVVFVTNGAPIISPIFHNNQFVINVFVP